MMCNIRDIWWEKNKKGSAVATEVSWACQAWLRKRSPDHAGKGIWLGSQAGRAVETVVTYGNRPHGFSLWRRTEQRIETPSPLFFSTSGQRSLVELLNLVGWEESLKITVKQKFLQLIQTFWIKPSWDESEKLCCQLVFKVLWSPDTLCSLV